MMTCDNKDCLGEPGVTSIGRYKLWMIEVVGSSLSDRVVNIDLCVSCKDKFKVLILSVVADMKGPARKRG